ncbi:MAG: DUF748 domain-containing protein [Rhodospirillaceae bacterium]|nr:DUF748 domain-containing protein [Rhodospirillaceae bacterium]
MSGLTVNIGGGEAMKLRLKKLDLEKLAGTGAPSLQVADISLQGLILSASSALLPPDSEVAEQPETVDEPSVSSEISIGRVTLEGPSEIALTDKRQSPAVSLKTKINRFEVQNFNTVQPAAKSSLAIAATINEFTDLSVGGWFNLAGDRPNFDLKTTFENLELPSFSRYAATHLGVNLESGRLSAEAEGKVVEGQLDAATKLNLLNLRFSPLSPEDSKRLSAATGVPIETAVGLLEDSDGKIELSIPVKGDLQNPDFDLDQVVGKAVGNAIAATIGTTLKVLFPPALLLSAFDAASEGGGVKFAPAPFDAGTTTLQPKGRELVDALASLLKQRPKLTVTLCGRATNDDVKAVLRPEVEAAMAERRAAYARDMAAYRVRLRPFIEAGVVDEAGKPLTKDVPKDLPAAPEQPVLDEASILAGLIAGRADELRDRLTALAADRTKTIRRDMAERLNVARGQVAECRPLFDLKDTAGPRAVFQL